MEDESAEILRVKACAKMLIECIDVNNIYPDIAVSAMLNLIGLICAEHSKPEHFEEVLNMLRECYTNHLGKLND